MHNTVERHRPNIDIVCRSIGNDTPSIWTRGTGEHWCCTFRNTSHSLLPAMLASSFAQMSARDRLQLKIGRTRSMEAYPGVERILNTLQERTLRERTRLMCALLAAGALNSEDSFETGQFWHRYSWIGLVPRINLNHNTLQLERRIPMTDSDFPLLSMHAPTLHQSTLKESLLI